MPRHDENKPTVVDLLLAKNAAEMRRNPETNFHRLKQAQVFVLDYDASFLVGQLISKAATLMLSQHEFARPPFEPTWVEIDYRAYMAGLVGPKQELADDKVDDRVGYLFQDGNLLFCSEKDGQVMIMPYWYNLHRPISFEEELELAQILGLSRLMLRRLQLGDSGIDPGWWNKAEADNFCRSHTLQISPTIVKEFGMSRHAIVKMLEGGAGSLKQGIALLLLLTRPGQEVVQLQAQGHRHKILKGKLRTLVTHNKVTLHLSVPKSVRKMVEALHTTGVHHRRHSVRGHWAQTRRGVQGCTHDWEPMTVDKYHCLRCRAKRWWKTDHHRGDIALGEVTKKYEVTK